MQGEPAETLQLQVSKPQTGSLHGRLNLQVFLAAYGGDRIFLIFHSSVLSVYLQGRSGSVVRWLHVAMHGVQIAVYFTHWQLALEKYTWHVLVSASL